MLEDDPDVERSVMIHQSTGKVLTQYCKLIYDKKEASIVQNSIDKYLQRYNFLRVSNSLNYSMLKTF